MPSKVELLAAQLSDRIFTGEDEPGTELTENEIANQYVVARPTARAAIKKLVSEDLLTRDIDKAARIPSMTDPTVVRELYLSRACIEREAMRQVAARRTIPQLRLPLCTRSGQRGKRQASPSSLPTSSSTGSWPMPSTARI